MNDLTFQIIEIVLSLVIVGLGYIIVFFRKKSEKFDSVCSWVEQAVKAAEKIFPNSGEGEKKKEYVVNFIKDVSKELNIQLTDEQVSVLIEAAIKDLDIISKQ